MDAAPPPAVVEALQIPDFARALRVQQLLDLPAYQFRKTYWLGRTRCFPLAERK
jgi:hypothetical protein